MLRQKVQSRQKGSGDPKLISRSASDLVAYTAEPRPNRTNPRRSTAELFQLALEERKDRSGGEDADEPPVLRKRRFTRKQRKSVTIEGGLILAVGAPESSSDDDEDVADRAAADDKTTTVVFRSSSLKESRESRPQSSNQLLCRRESSPRNKSAVRGPAARRASRLHKQNQQNAASTGHLNMLTGCAGLRQDSRSMSVRDLNGEDVDFRNRDSVTKWTSQILAELDSLPSSRTDLSKEPRENRFSMQLQPPTTLMTSSLFAPSRATSWLGADESWTSASMVDLNHSLFDSAAIEKTIKEREESILNTSTLGGSSTDSDGEGTPTAVSPEPVRKTILPETPQRTFVRHSSTSLLSPPTQKAPPVPAKRTKFVKEEPTAEEKKPSFFEDLLKETDRKLHNSIARITRSVYGEIKDSVNAARLSAPWTRSEMNLETFKNTQNDDSLSKWKITAEQRARTENLVDVKVEEVNKEEDNNMDIRKPVVYEQKPTVNSVVAALIKTVEESRFSASDRPKDLPLPSSSSSGPELLSPQEAATQTTPFSVSRSSSFDWINEPTEKSLRDLKTPLETPRSENSPMFCKPFESSSDEADREVARISSKFDDTHKTIRDNRLTKKIDEGIAMLLEVGDSELTSKPPVSPHRTVRSNYDSLPSNFRQSGGRRLTANVESIYDNMPWDRKKHLTKTGLCSPLVVPKHTARPVVDIKLPGLNAKTLSCELVDEEPEMEERRRVQQLAEKESEEACDWLLQAGFPQYVKQFREGEFPIETTVVRRDHEFLGTDSLRALFRRIDTLNRCAIMRVDNVVMRRRNDNGSMYGFDEEDEGALSNNWKFNRNGNTWARIPNEPIYGVNGRVVSTKPNWHPYMERYTPHGTLTDRVVTRTDCYEAFEPSRPPVEQQNNGTASSSSGIDSSDTAKLQRSQSERLKERARAIMKKMDLRSNTRRRKESRPRDPAPAPRTIGDPVLISYDTASPESLRMLQTARPTNLQGSGTTRLSRGYYTDQPISAAGTQRSKSARRQGVVMLTPSSPESSTDDSSSFFSPPTSSSSYRRREYSMPPAPRSTDRRRDYVIDSGVRRRNPFDAYLYPETSASLSRSTVLSRNGGSRPIRPTVYDTTTTTSNFYTPSSRRDSREYTSRNYVDSATIKSPPAYKPQNLLIQEYCLHDSPDLRQRRMEASPSTSQSSHLKVDTNKSESDPTDEETLTSTLHRRRDSGVGSSLSRSPSGPSTQRLRQSVLQYAGLTTSMTSTGTWQNKKRGGALAAAMSSSIASSVNSEESFFTDVELTLCIDSLSVIELLRLRKMAYLRVSAILEKTMGAGAVKMSTEDENSPAKANWSVHRWMKRMKPEPKAREDDSTVFGLSLGTIYKKTGLSLPRSILEVLRYLRQLAPDTVGMFRKNGVKSRIAELRAVCDRVTDQDVFIGDNKLDAGQVHDVADLLKQYLRELPEPLMTIRLSEMFANIFTHVPEVDRLTTLQYALLLLPDENREAVQTLLFFLHDVAKCSEVNNMNCQNLAVCFTPSLFQLSASRLDKVSSTRRHKTIGAAGMPTAAEMKETQACQQCLTTMIEYARTIFMVPDAVEERTDYEDDVPLVKDLGLKGPRSYLIDKVVDMIKDHGDKWKSWTIEGLIEGVEVTSKKDDDSHPLKTFRVWIDVAAPPKEVVHRIMKERAVWDSSVINWRTVEMVAAPDTDIHQYVVNDTVGHPTRDCYLARFHSSGLTEIRGACAIAERSVRCADAQMLGGVSATVLDQRFLVEPKSGHSRVTFIARIDFKGRSTKWYNSIYGSLMAKQMQRLRDSFQTVEDVGPETKV